MTDIFLGLASLAPVILVGCFLVWQWITMAYCCLSRGWLWGLRWNRPPHLGDVGFSAFGFSFAVIGLLAPLLGFLVGAFLFARRHWLKGRSESLCRLPRFHFGGWSGSSLQPFVIETSAAFFHAWLLPMEAYDAVSNWGLKAKLSSGRKNSGEFPAESKL
jgi:hypothetical protein